MSRVLQTQALLVRTTALDVWADSVAAPGGTTKVTIASPVAARFYVGPEPQYSFTSKIYAVVASNPTNGKTFSVMGTTFTFVTSGSGSTQIVIGANLSATMVNLAAKLGSTLGSGYQVTNLDPTIPGVFQIWRTSVVGVGPAADAALYVTNSTGGPLSVPASGMTRYGSGGAGTYVPAGGSVTLDAEEGDSVSTLSGGTGSDPTTGAGATATFQGT